MVICVGSCGGERRKRESISTRAILYSVRCDRERASADFSKSVIGKVIRYVVWLIEPLDETKCRSSENTWYSLVTRRAALNPFRGVSLIILGSFYFNNSYFKLANMSSSNNRNLLSELST